MSAGTTAKFDLRNGWELTARALVVSRKAHAALQAECAQRLQDAANSIRQLEATEREFARLAGIDEASRRRALAGNAPTASASGRTKVQRT